MFQRNEGLPHHPAVRPTQIQAQPTAQQGLPTQDHHVAPASKAEEMIALLNQRVGQSQSR